MELKQDEATSLLVKVQQNSMLHSVEVVVMKGFRLVVQNLLSLRIYRSKKLSILCREVMHIQRLVLNKEHMLSDSLRCETFSFNLENHETAVVACSEVVESGMSGKNPESVAFLSERVDLNSSTHVP